MAKTKKSVLPKRVAGVKISKKLRKGPIGKALASTAGQAMLVEAALLASGALMNKQAQPGAPLRRLGETSTHKAGNLVKAAGEAGTGAVAGVGDAAGVLAYAFGEGARAFMAALREHEGASPQPEADDGGHWTEEEIGRPQPSRPGKTGAGSRH
jgi:hypothetical protein